MTATFDRSALLAALDRVGAAAAAAGVRLDAAVYGGSALMLASNFRYASEDVDVAAIARPWPRWLEAALAAIAADNGWAEDWFNDAVAVHLSPHADPETDHVPYGTFPRGADVVGLRVFVPTAEYLFALKLKAMRVNDPVRGPQEARDIVNLARVLRLATPEDAIAVLARYFPRSGADAAKQRFLLTHIWHVEGEDAPAYPLLGD